MNHPSHALRGTAALLATGLLLAGCAAGTPGTGSTDSTSTDSTASDSTAAQTGDLHDVTLMLNWTPNGHHAGIYYALEQGYYEDAGINLEIVEPGADVGADFAVSEGTVQFGISQAESLLPARAEGLDVQAIATLLPTNDSVLMGLEGSGLTEDPASLAGLIYGGYGGSLETEIISQLVTCAGGDPEDVEFVDIGNVDYLAGLEQERFDVTWVFGGWDALRAETEREDLVTIAMSDHEDCIPNWYTPVIIGNETAMTEDPALAESFLEATTRGYEAVIADPQVGSAALIAGAPELDAEHVAASVEYYAPLYAEDGSFGEMTAEVWDEFGEFLVQAGMLEDATAVDGSWTNDYLPER